MNDTTAATDKTLDVAIIGMAARFPGSENIEEFWQKLCEGKECISFFSDEELESQGVGSNVYRNRHYVRAGGILDSFDLFDAQFFGYSAREAELIDPQQRLFLECAWHALEHAAIDPQSYEGAIGVYAGTAISRYMRNIYSDAELLESAGSFQIGLANDKDFLATRVSYKLNLEGPSVGIQTACSTSLVAVHLACQSLLTGECDVALAGAVRAGEELGYMFREGGIASPDGHCRAFDVRAQGTVPGNGVGIVVLKRFEEAFTDGDCIHAIIKGSAINNDGGLKIGYTAPRIEGQAAVIRTAQLAACVEPETISYIEGHGTGTELGDPIEVAALTKAFRARTLKKNFCALGSVKTNIGHLDAAAGIAGLIKTVLSLKKKIIPPSLHFATPNPKIDFVNSPFYVNSRLSEWKSEGVRRAGVSSFGMGGTNAHVVLEEARDSGPSGASRPWQLLLMSAKTDTALNQIAANLASHLRNHPELNLADVAHTLRVGRTHLSHRRMLVCRDVEDALRLLDAGDERRVATGICEAADSPIVFMFSGLGDQRVNMARDIYEAEPLFRKKVDYCSEVLIPLLGADIRHILFKKPGNSTDQCTCSEEPGGLDLKRLLRSHSECSLSSVDDLNRTRWAQPAIFVVEYALAELWMSWGVQPKAMVGYSIGEYVAASLAGVFSLEDALLLVAKRAQLIDQLPAGAMLAVSLSEAELSPFLNAEVSLAAINGPSMCVIAGTPQRVGHIENDLTAKGVACRRLLTTHAFHSAMMKSIADSLTKVVERVELNRPRIPYLSNVTGDWIDEEAVDPCYWAKHMCETVRFSDCIKRACEASASVLLEVGPGQSLSSLAILNPANNGSADRIILSSLPNSLDHLSDACFLLHTLGKLWLTGVRLKWNRFGFDEKRQRVPLPEYPFERQRFWVERQHSTNSGRKVSHQLAKRANVDDWLYLPSWKRSAITSARFDGHGREALLFIHQDEIGPRICHRLRELGWNVATVQVGNSFATESESRYVLDAENSEDYEKLFDCFVHANTVPNLIVHLWNLPTHHPFQAKCGSPLNSEYLGFYSLLFLAQALGTHKITKPICLSVISDSLYDLTGQEELCPERITMLGPVKTIPQEYPNIECRSIDVEAGQLARDERLVNRLCDELVTGPNDSVVAYRQDHRWTQDFEPIRFEDPSISPRWRDRGVYMIVGGLGHIGLVLAEELAHDVRGRLVLIGRSSFPPRGLWSEWLTRHSQTDETSRKIGKLLEFEQLGCEILVIKADVADQCEMQEVIAQTFERFGELNGVIHAAGIVGKDSVCSLQTTNETKYEQQARAKIKGLRVLEEVLHSHQLDFCLVFSSLTSVLGGLGFTAYTAANVFVDAFAAKQSRKGATPWISLNSDAWRFSSESVDSALTGSFGLGELAMSPEEGKQVVRRVLSLSGVAQVVVSTAHLQTRIDRWIKLDSLRKGKTSQRQTPLSLHRRPSLHSQFVEPKNHIEEKLTVLWQDLLGFAPVGVNDNFFEMGGHSLLIVQMASRLQDLFQIDMPVTTLFETPTVAGLARKIEATVEIGAARSATRIEPVGREAPLPLSFAQQRLWLMDQIKPGNSAYNLENPILLSGRLNIQALDQILTEIERRHEILRSTFPTVDGKPIQVNTPSQRISLPLVDLSGLPDRHRETVVRKLAFEEASRVFDLERGPLLRSTILRLSTEQHVLLFTVHHIISDAWSMDVLIREVSSLYHVFQKGEKSTLPELEIQYADYAVWQRQQLKGAELEAHLSYWKKQLAGCPELLALPTDWPRPKHQSFAGASQSFQLPRDLTPALRRLASSHQATLFMTLLAAFQATLHRYTGEEDIVVGSPVANRRCREVELLIGFFVNPLVLRTDLSGNPSFSQLLTRVRQITLEAQTHQDVPFELLVEALQPQRSTSYTPLFQVVFVLDHVPRQRETILNDLKLSPFPVETDTCPVDLHMAMTDRGEEIDGLLTYDRMLFNQSTISAIIRTFLALLAAVSANAKRRILDIPLHEAELRQSTAAISSRDSVLQGQFVFGNPVLDRVAEA